MLSIFVDTIDAKLTNVPSSSSDGSVQSEYLSLSRANKHGGSNEPGTSQPLLSFGWKRIILDEAHGIKNPGTIVSKACCLLRADSRWCVTGSEFSGLFVAASFL